VTCEELEALRLALDERALQRERGRVRLALAVMAVGGVTVALGALGITRLDAENRGAVLETSGRAEARAVPEARVRRASTPAATSPGNGSPGVRAGLEFTPLTAAKAP
jgi:hypothetical protein